MGPKKGKDVTDDEYYWKTIIEETPLNDETWTVQVILIEAAGSEHDHIYLNKFENCAAEERRFVIKNICKTETIFMINQLGGEKKVKDDKLRVFEEGQSYLKEKKDVPPEVMALVIKHLILKMKEEYLFIERQRLEVREGMKKESSTMIGRAEVRGTVNVKTLEPQEPPAQTISKKKTEQTTVANPIEIDENKKYNTLLRMRGEEWRDKTYIDDYPLDGPNLYVAVTGFLQPTLADCLIKIGIPLTAVVQVRIDLTSTTIPSSLLRASKRGQSQTNVLAEKSLKFWEDLQQIRINKNTTDYFKNTAFILFTPPYWNFDKLSGSTEIIYNELCYLMYDIQDLTRQHLHYLDNMDIITIPEENTLDEYHLTFYESQMNEIPLESVTIYLILDAMLQTVCKDKSSNASISSKNYTCSLTHQNKSKDNNFFQSDKLVKDLIGRFCKYDSQRKKYKVTYGEEKQDLQKTIVINYGDFSKNSSFHLSNINLSLDNLLYSMLHGMPVNNLWLNRNKPTEEMNIRNNYHINLILSCFDREDVETAELNRLIHILACRKLYNNRSSLRKTHILPSTITEFKKMYLKRSILAEPLTKYSFHNCHASNSSSFHYLSEGQEESYETISDVDSTFLIEKLFSCPDISELVSVTEISNQTPTNHMIDHYEFFQDFRGSSAFQVTLDAFNKYNCLDYKYCEVTDCYIAMFYNSHDNKGISRHEWRCHLPTPLCLQDFFDFVLEEQYDWIKNEEKIYDENMLFSSLSECKNTKNSCPVNSCVENNEVEFELLMEGSLKYDDINNVELNDFETSSSKIMSLKKTPLSTTDLDSMKSGKKTKSPALSTPKVIDPEPGGDTNVLLTKKPFSGYNLGDRRVEVFGRDSSYFAKDGTRVSSFYSLTIPMNLEYASLNIVLGNSDNEFWIHKAIGEVNNTDPIDIGDSFRINTKDQVIVYIKKQVYAIVPSFSNLMSEESIHKTNVCKSPSSPITDGEPEHYEKKSFYSLIITCPNGHITESVHENNSSKISHIKQHYLIPLPNHDEDMRCISLNGEVLIFKKNNEIEILNPDSSYMKILKFEKKIVNEENDDSLHNSSSDKMKKGKDKPNKTSSKPLKKKVVDDDKIIHGKLEYELFIEEFECIENNGLRQRWIENNQLNIEKLLIKTATDFCLGEIYSKRMDGTTILLSKCGKHIVTFPNNTRIISSYTIGAEEIFPEWTEEEISYFSIMSHFNVDFSTPENSRSQSYSVHSDSDKIMPNNLHEINKKFARDDGFIAVYMVYTVEHPLFTTVTINKYDGKISVESPNNSCVTFDTANNYEFSLDKQTSAQFDGENLNIKHCVCSECNSYNNCEVRIKCEEIDSVTNVQKHWLKMTDSFLNQVSVDMEGNINVMEDVTNDQTLKGSHSKEHVQSTKLNENRNNDMNIPKLHKKCEEMWEAESLKFFILRRYANLFILRKFVILTKSNLQLHFCILTTI